MRLAAMLCFLVFIGLPLLTALLWRRRAAAPLYLRLAEDTENTEWLIRELLRQAPRRQLIIVGPSGGENRNILQALARRYHICFMAEAPAGAPVLIARRGISARELIRQYKKLGQEEATE